MSERPTEIPGAPRARMMLQRAHWAATAFAAYDPERTRRIVDAVAAEAYRNAERYAEWAVRETGMGVVEHKRRKNEACSQGLVDWYGGHDYVSARFDPEHKIVELPRPAGVVLALTPSTNPIATVYYKVLLALMTRNAVVVSPHPLAREVSVDAVQRLVEGEHVRRSHPAEEAHHRPCLGLGGGARPGVVAAGLADPPVGVVPVEVDAVGVAARVVGVPVGVVDRHHPQVQAVHGLAVAQVGQDPARRRLVAVHHRDQHHLRAARLPEVPGHDRPALDRMAEHPATDHRRAYVV